MMILLNEVFVAGACLVLSAAALNDLASRTIPNEGVAAIAGIGLVLRAADGNAVASLAASAAIVILGALALSRGIMGGGDAKLFAASALLVRPIEVPSFLAATAFAGGALGLVYLTLQRIVPAPAPQRPITRAARILRAEQWRVTRRAGLPYGLAIATGAIVTMFGERL